MSLQRHDRSGRVLDQAVTGEDRPEPPEPPASVRAPHEHKAHQRQLVRQVPGADAGEEDLHAVRYLAAGRCGRIMLLG